MAVLVLLATTAGAWIVAANLGTLVADGTNGTLWARADRGCIGARGIGFSTTVLTVALLAWLGFTLLDVLLGGRFGYLTTHEHGDGLAIHDADHLLEHVERLGFVDHERVLLFVAGVLHTLAQLVHLTQVLLPVLIDGEQHDGLLPSLG